ncbi:MAG: methyltransferase [Rhodothalassiaceae bacterium]|nr:MAG: methyltransferase [Rhodothalassiaceae bacterium]
MATHRWTGMLAALTALLLMGALPPAAAQEGGEDPILRAVTHNPWRKPEDRARDKYRHPVETLRFFGIRPDMTVVELHPGAGWYTRILAPLLHDRGTWIGADYDPELFPEGSRFRAAMESLPARVKANPDFYGPRARVGYVVRGDYADPGSVDMVLGIRFMHNWIRNGIAEKALANVYRALKPGGVFGVVQHRAAEDDPRDDLTLANNGYVKESTMIRLAEAAGFKLVARSEINANPKDTRDHPRGVWTLPPTLALGDEDRDKYLAIGESDRMTLKFVKPR